jgi:hypothetical protein
MTIPCVFAGGPLSGKLLFIPRDVWRVRAPVPHETRFGSVEYARSLAFPWLFTARQR